MLRCGDRTCGRCRGKDFYRLCHAYRKPLGKMKSPKLVTLTLPNVADLTKVVVQRLRAAATRLFRRKRWASRIRGGIYSIEAVNKGRGWHVHVHMVVDADYLPHRELSEDWRKVTGDAFIVDVRRAWSPQEALKYILKYLLKPPQILDGQEAVYNEVLKGIRLVQPFGSFYREIKQEKPPVVCPECGCTGWITKFELSRYRGAMAVLLVAEQFRAWDTYARAPSGTVSAQQGVTP